MDWPEFSAVHAGTATQSRPPVAGVPPPQPAGVALAPALQLLHAAVLDDDAHRIRHVVTAAGVGVDAVDASGATPLLLAAKHNKCKAAKVLATELGAKVNQKDGNGCTPCYVAAALGHARILEVLYAAGASMTEPAGDGATPVLIAAQNDHADVLELLCGEYGADCNTAKRGGVTPVFSAATLGNEACLRLLVFKFGAAVDAANVHGFTPLMGAAYRGITSCMKILIAAQAQAGIRDKTGKTALDWAQSRKQAEAVELLQLARRDPIAIAAEQLAFVFRNLVPRRTDTPNVTTPQANGAVASGVAVRKGVDRALQSMRQELEATKASAAKAAQQLLQQRESVERQLARSQQALKTATLLHAAVASPGIIDTALAACMPVLHRAQRPPLLLNHGRRSLGLADFDVHERVGRRSAAGAGAHRLRYFGVNAAVYRATHKQSGSMVAVKAMLALKDDGQGAITDAALKHRYGTEYRLLKAGARLPPHANITPVLGTFVGPVGRHVLPSWDMDETVALPKTLFVVMPWMGDTLQARLAAARAHGGTGLPAQFVAFVGLQLAKALLHCHHHRIVHRDVKPDNVLLGSGIVYPASRTSHAGTTAGAGLGAGAGASTRRLEPQVPLGSGGPPMSAVDNTRAVLCDFGDSLDCMELSLDGFRMPHGTDMHGVAKGGAPAFIAPEVARARPGFGAVIDFGAQDAWSLGLVMWAMLTAKAPFAGSSPDPRKYSEATRVHLDSSFGDKVPHGLLFVIDALLRVDHTRRMPLSAAVQALEVLVWFGRDGHGLLPSHAPDALKGGRAATAGATTGKAGVEERLAALKRHVHATFCHTPPCDTTVADACLADFLLSGHANAQHVVRVGQRIGVFHA